MKIEDINYDLPTKEINEEDFDKEKWLQEHPIDYFKFLYVLFTTASKVSNPTLYNVAMDFTFQALYRVIRLYIPDTLYKFYSLTHDVKLNATKLTTLRNKQIFMSDIKDFNDPFDSKAFYYNPDELKDIERLALYDGKLIDDFTTFHKGTSLTENDTSCLPMWAHYSNNHQGFCVAYDMKNPNNQNLCGCTFPIQYTDQRLDITTFMKKYASMISEEIDKQNTQGIKQVKINDLSLIYVEQLLSNIKHITWQYEKEFRCTMGAIAKGMPYVDAIPKAIYIGMKCDEKHRKELIVIAKELSIPIYLMCFNELSENYSLEEKLLKV